VTVDPDALMMESSQEATTVRERAPSFGGGPE
jgi:hypothetical protein